MKRKWKPSPTPSKKPIGAARTRPRCWELVTKHCSTKFASSVWIPDGRLAPGTRKIPREAEEELPALGRYPTILPQLASIASASSTCKGLLILGGGISRIARKQFLL